MLKIFNTFKFPHPKTSSRSRLMQYAFKGVHITISPIRKLFFGILKWSCLILLFHILFSDTNLISKSFVVAASQIDKFSTHVSVIQSDSDLNRQLIYVPHFSVFACFFELPQGRPIFCLAVALSTPYTKTLNLLHLLSTRRHLMSSFATPPWTLSHHYYYYTNIFIYIYNGPTV